MFEIRWHGRGGQGSFTGAKLLGEAAAIFDKRYAQAFPSFGPERRGAPVLGFNRISDVPVTDRSELKACDVIVFLDDTLWSEAYLSDLKEDAVVLMNTTSSVNDPRIKTIDATGMAIDIIKRPIGNTAMLGFLAALKPEIVSYKACEDAVASSLKPSLAQMNIELLKAAFDYGKEYK
ncbi:MULTISPECIES: 2-oxoacid:acceptor oxidoreductase family protein [unclassified Fusibacter]|uniref:2-oxoacid:acceptor oxidoreductase family protein n=1 Tax=unclassified Fusibacter TaxID=2624464 RepID=UPI001010574F|nr:2-oxoacid:acceptor oxidoreductase family protein [Fusibacter sp. A1]MCK8058733.1 2-oxoacid:acceptor oxidoreductase family protein [Fusibacter sp. A2]NPE21807.1 pyruvate ferredoxin oxidoreductase [Fusibacter sp. A1]RXV61379.1 pyruvate ferredoxin oxidoreductase [Fusibacter sp. A1]